jgi:hypothetical protein
MAFWKKVGKGALAVGKFTVNAAVSIAVETWEDRENIIARAQDRQDTDRRRYNSIMRERAEKEGLPPPQPIPPVVRNTPNSNVSDLAGAPSVVLDWQPLEGGLNADLSAHNKNVGLYRIKNADGEVIYLGRELEHDNGGFRKRLRDYTRNSKSGRTHKSGMTINNDWQNHSVELLITGSDAEAAALARKLEPAAIRADQPLLNKHHK